MKRSKERELIAFLLGMQYQVKNKTGLFSIELINLVRVSLQDLLSFDLH